MDYCVFSKSRNRILSEEIKSICCLLFWKTNRKRLMCLLQDISASLFLVSASSLLDLDGKKKYIHSGNLENGVYFFSPVSQEQIGKSIYSVTVNNPLLRELPLYLPRFISLNQQTSAINPHKKQRPLRGNKEFVL